MAIIKEPYGSVISPKLYVAATDGEKIYKSRYTVLEMSDFNLQVSLGNVPGYTSVNKFGQSDNVDNGVDTDIWDRANTTNDQDIWIAPTQARQHQIVSSSASDTSAGAGARTIRVYGLTSWATEEVSEDITMNGTTNVNTTNNYVIIHRMKVLTSGATDINVGTITATAATDLTVTAQINSGMGQTEMAIYGVPSGKTFCLMKYYASAIKAGTALSVAISLLVNENPDVQLTNFITKHTLGAATEGTSDLEHRCIPPITYDGPCIVKMQANSTSNDTIVSAGFDGIMKDTA